MLDLHFFQNPRFSAASSAITITFFAMFGTLFLMTQYLQLVLGYSTVKAGAILLPQAATIMVAAPFSSVWVRRFGNKVVMSTGLLIVALSYALIAMLTASSGSLQVIACTMVMGLGMGNVMAPATDSIMGSLPRAKAGVGSAVNDTTRQFGGAMGVAVFGSLLVSRYSDNLTSRLSGKMPSALLDQAKESVGSALNIARDVPEAKPFAPQLVQAARESFVSGLHFAAVLAIVMLLIAAGLVFRFLPARATEEEAPPSDMVPVGVGPVDVVGNELSADLVEAVERA
jgi:Na+/melibiose symporter-like transporter